RAIRAVRFAEKLGFRISKHTENLIKLAVKMGIFEKLKGSRLYEELMLLFKETIPQQAIKRLKDYGLLKVIHPKLEEKEIKEILTKAYEVIQGVELLFLKEKYHVEFIYLMVILWQLEYDERIELLDKISAPEHIKKKVIYDIETAKKSLQLLNDDDPVKVYNTLKSLNTETLILMMIYSQKWQKQLISLFITNLRHVKPLIKGEDLKKIGIKPGPIYREIFEKIMNEKLRGKLQSKEEEIEFAKNIIISNY
ncbi:MAG: hypothetical protein N2647_01015, partial [Thermodesulfovibrio sp.]|nr:hypothetical protein [Thermodesulfovibrio sp.]